MIKTDLLEIVNANHKRVRLIREEQREKRIDTILTILSVIVVCIIFAVSIYANLTKDYVYAVAKENSFGNHYEYVTDRVCTVTEINGDLITVETRNGDLYEFYGDGFEIDETIVCTFNSANELINAE